MFFFQDLGFRFSDLGGNLKNYKWILKNRFHRFKDDDCRLNYLVQKEFRYYKSLKSLWVRF